MVGHTNHAATKAAHFLQAMHARRRHRSLLLPPPRVDHKQRLVNAEAKVAADAFQQQYAAPARAWLKDLWDTDALCLPLGVCAPSVDAEGGAQAEEEKGEGVVLSEPRAEFVRVPLLQRFSLSADARFERQLRDAARWMGASLPEWFSQARCAPRGLSELQHVLQQGVLLFASDDNDQFDMAILAGEELRCLTTSELFIMHNVSLKVFVLVDLRWGKLALARWAMVVRPARAVIQWKSKFPSSYIDLPHALWRWSLQELLHPPVLYRVWDSGERRELNLRDDPQYETLCLLVIALSDARKAAMLIAEFLAFEETLDMRYPRLVQEVVEYGTTTYEPIIHIASNARGVLTSTTDAAGHHEVALHSIDEDTTAVLKVTPSPDGDQRPAQREWTLKHTCFPGKWGCSDWRHETHEEVLATLDQAHEHCAWITECPLTDQSILGTSVSSLSSSSSSSAGGSSLTVVERDGKPSFRAEDDGLALIDAFREETIALVHKRAHDGWKFAELVVSGLKDCEVGPLVLVQTRMTATAEVVVPFRRSLPYDGIKVRTLKWYTVGIFLPTLEGPLEPFPEGSKAKSCIHEGSSPIIYVPGEFGEIKLDRNSEADMRFYDPSQECTIGKHYFPRRGDCVRFHPELRAALLKARYAAQSSLVSLALQPLSPILMPGNVYVSAPGGPRADDEAKHASPASSASTSSSIMGFLRSMISTHDDGDGEKKEQKETFYSGSSSSASSSSAASEASSFSLADLPQVPVAASSSMLRHLPQAHDGEQPSSAAILARLGQPSSSSILSYATAATLSSSSSSIRQQASSSSSSAPDSLSSSSSSSASASSAQQASASSGLAGSSALSSVSPASAPEGLSKRATKRQRRAAAAAVAMAAASTSRPAAEESASELDNFLGAASGPISSASSAATAAEGASAPREPSILDRVVSAWNGLFDPETQKPE